MSRTPGASVSALMKAGGEPIALASPPPFTPSGLCVQAVTVWSTVKLGRSSARGMVSSMEEPASSRPDPVSSITPSLIAWPRPCARHGPDSKVAYRAVGPLDAKVGR